MAVTYVLGLPPWLLLIVALALYFGFLWAVTRLVMRTRERVRCPVRGKAASVVFLRGPDGAREDVIRCSLLETEPGLACDKDCLHPADQQARTG
jgi:hypothetical protein